MKGDFTRNTFERSNHYSSVRSQQGRVQVDADWNEAVDILAHRDRTTRRDVIGLCGGPQGQDGAGNDLAGFRIDAVDDELRITKGRYYVDGLLVENEDEVAITEQPDLPYPPENTIEDVLVPRGEALAAGTYLAYLDVWERHVTALEAPGIREVALGGPDTTTRTKVVWQVRLMRAQNALDCASELPLWDEVTAPSSGRLSARAEPGEEETDPCEVPAQAGYRGLENQLYRVEVHRVISADEITIKWSRENGSVVFGWEGQDSLDPDKLTLGSAGRDDVLGLATDDWVELTDDRHELRGEPGLLVQVVNVEGNILTIDPGAETVDIADFPIHPKVRRWDMPRDAGEIAVDLSLADNWIALEHGVEVKLEPGTYRTGDYWSIPARTVARDIEWPRDDANVALSQPPHGIRHHYCRLALLGFDGTNWERLGDCRNLFPPLTEMVRFFHVAGDGQEAMPGRPVPRTLEVGVANGQWPVAGARVRFQVVDGGGRLRPGGAGPCPGFNAGGANAVEVETGPDGIAGCCWRLDAVMPSQRVEATLLEIDGKPLVDDAGTPMLTPIRFNANLSVASQVAYNPERCSNLSDVTTVQEAIDILCQIQPGGGCSVTVGEGGEYERLDLALKALLERGLPDICICLLPGDHPFSGLEIEIPIQGPELHITIRGCGPGSRVLLEQPLRFTRVKACTLRDVALEVCFLAEGELAAIAFDRCSHVTLTGCRVAGFTRFAGEVAEGALLSITNADRILLKDNALEAALPESLDVTVAIFEEAGVDFLAELFSAFGPDQCGTKAFRELALQAAFRMFQMNRDERQNLRQAIRVVLDGFRDQLSDAEVTGFGKLLAELGVERPAVEDLYDTLWDMRRAAIKSRPGVALILGSRVDLGGVRDPELIAVDQDDHATLESNQIVGILSLYGMPPMIELVLAVFGPDIQKQLEERLRSGQISLRNLGWLGAVQLRGNQVVRIAVAWHVVERLVEIAGGAQAVPPTLFNRCLASDNVIEGGHNWMVSVHQGMTGNDFPMRASLPKFGGSIGWVVADSTVYVGNHSGNPEWELSNISSRSSQAANLDINIT